MDKLFVFLLLATTGGALPIPARAQLLPPGKRSAQLHITQGPLLESARETSAIIRWTSDNPGGDPEHFGVVHFGTDRSKLNQTAKSHIRLNQGHTYTVFRVQLYRLQPGTTYFYTVSSQGDGVDDGVRSTVNQFNTPGAAPSASLRNEKK